MHGFKDALDLQKYLLYEGEVAVLARIFFGEKNEGEAEEYIRLSYATSKDLINTGMERITKVLADEKRIDRWVNAN